MLSEADFLSYAFEKFKYFWISKIQFASDKMTSKMHQGFDSNITSTYYRLGVALYLENI